MAIPPHKAPGIGRAVDTYTLGTGRMRTPATSALTSNLPALVGPTQLIGVGFAPFTVPVHAGNGTVTVGFSNLPHGNGASLAASLQSSGIATTIRDNYSLLFVTTLQNSDAPSSGALTVNPQAIDDQGVIATASLLGSRTYRAFQATLAYKHSGKNPPATVTGTVVGQLLLVSKAATPTLNAVSAASAVQQ